MRVSFVILLFLLKWEYMAVEWVLNHVLEAATDDIDDRLNRNRNVGFFYLFFGLLLVLL